MVDEVIDHWYGSEVTFYKVRADAVQANLRTSADEDVVDPAGVPSGLYRVGLPGAAEYRLLRAFLAGDRQVVVGGHLVYRRLGDGQIAAQLWSERLIEVQVAHRVDGGQACDVETNHYVRVNNRLVFPLLLGLSSERINQSRCLAVDVGAPALAALPQILCLGSGP